MAGRARARAMTTRPSSGSLTNALGVRRLGWSGATRATHTSKMARIVSTAAILVRTRPRLGRHEWRLRTGSTIAATPLCVACRWLHNHHTSRPNDSASRASAATRAAWVRASGRMSQPRSSERPLSRSDDLAPVARRQRLTHPRQHHPAARNA